MKLIIGLGNPGPKYHNTRHNVGFVMMDSLFSKYDGEAWKDSKFKGLIASFQFPLSSGGKMVPVTLLKPTTFMNLSGESVASIVSFYKLNPAEDILVLVDDIDMEFGKVRYRSKGSSGGQNGIKSIIEHLGTDEFSRIKIGIGRDERYTVSDWVLSAFTKEERTLLDEVVFDTVLEKVEEWIHNS